MNISRNPPISLISAFGVKNKPCANIFSAISMLIDNTKMYSTVT